MQFFLKKVYVLKKLRGKSRRKLILIAMIKGLISMVKSLIKLSKFRSKLHS